VLFNDTYQTISDPSEGLFKDRGSKFLAFAFPIAGEKDVKIHVLALKELHSKAVHHCYAYRLGLDRTIFRVNDDGEPSGTAGRPILNVLFSREITNILVVVVRYFGGTLLGVPGLINAYKTATEMALDDSFVVTRYLFNLCELHFAYVQMNDVMRIVKEMELIVSNQVFEMECAMIVEVRVVHTERFVQRCEKITGLSCTWIRS
jgi:uncharacterized YigZ family protein